MLPREWRTKNREASPVETKEKALHTPSPALVKANGKLAEELSQRTLKRLQSGAAWPEGCHNQWKKPPLDPGSEIEGCVCSRKRHFHWKTGTKCLLQAWQLCLGQQALSRNIAVLNRGVTERHCRSYKFTLNTVQTKEHARGSWSVLENMGAEHSTHMLPSPPAKSRWITTLLEWLCTSAKEQMGPTNIPHVADTGTLVQPVLPSPPYSHSPAPGPKPPHCSHTCHHCWLWHCANRISEQNRNYSGKFLQVPWNKLIW